MFIQVHQQSDVIALFYLIVAHYYFHVNGTLRHKKMQFNLSSK